jgi:hypothetical protein
MISCLEDFLLTHPPALCRGHPSTYRNSRQIRTTPHAQRGVTGCKENGVTIDHARYAATKPVLFFRAKME